MLGREEQNLARREQRSMDRDQGQFEWLGPAAVSGRILCVERWVSAQQQRCQHREQRSNSAVRTYQADSRSADRDTPALGQVVDIEYRANLETLTSSVGTGILDILQAD